MLLLRSEIPSGKCAKLHTVAASSNRDHTPWSPYCCLFVLHIYSVILRVHAVHGDLHIQCNEVATQCFQVKCSLQVCFIVQRLATCQDFMQTLWVHDWNSGSLDSHMPCVCHLHSRLSIPQHVYHSHHKTFLTATVCTVSQVEKPLSNAQFSNDSTVNFSKTTWHNFPT